MNVLQGFCLYLLGAFILVVLALFNIVPTNYLGGFVIAGFIGGLFFAWLNAWHQGEKMSKTTAASKSQYGKVAAAQAVTASEELKNYPCMKEIMTGTREGNACIYSAGCELAPMCATISSKAVA
jgi:hypothetical protein